MDQVFLTCPLTESKPRRRLNEPHRWTDQEAYQLLLEVSKDVKQRAGGYEKPTSQKFYSNIATRNKQLSHIPWQVMKAKMRYFRITFLRKNNGTLQNPKTKKCPSNELLDFIFSQKEMSEATEEINQSTVEFFSDVADDTYVEFDDSKNAIYNEASTDFTLNETEESQQNKKTTRLRNNKTHWWTKEETTTFINSILKAIGDEPNRFEEPTARIFYESHCKQGVLKNIPWHLMRSKMRYFRVLFYKAEKWLEDVGTELFKTDSKHIKTRIHSICPYYDELRPIFESRGPMDPIKVSWHSTITKMSAGNKTQSNDNTEHTPSLFKIENDADMDDSSMVSEDDATFRAQEEAQMKDEVEEDEFVADNASMPEVFLEKGNIQKAVLALQREKLEFEKHKFEIECEQRKQQHELQQKLLDMEREKLEFEKHKLVEQENLKRYEIDQNIALKKLELAKNERLQKIELQYKYQPYQTNEALEAELQEEEQV